jgi:tetratricopeptide (TPR) repeat protein
VSPAAGGGGLGSVHFPRRSYYRDVSYGNESCWYFPWGYSWYGGSWNFCWSNWRWGCWYSWWWGCSYSWYYPYWYVYYSPYWSSYPTYTTVVYETVYEDDSDTSAASEPIGEAAAGAVQERPAVPARASSLTIAAERYLTLGDRAFREGRWADAVQFYGKAVEFAPTEGALWLVLADALFSTGDYHYAGFAVRKALELDPTLVDSAVDKHTFYADPAEFDRQIAALETYLVAHPTDRDARLVLSLNCLFGNRPAQAVDLLGVAEAVGLRDEPATVLILASAQRAQFGAVGAPEAE